MTFITLLHGTAVVPWLGSGDHMALAPVLTMRGVMNSSSSLFVLVTNAVAEQVAQDRACLPRNGVRFCVVCSLLW